MSVKTQTSVGTNLKVEPKVSWIDSLTIWIDQLPLPAWLFYLIAIIAGEILISLVFWIDGSVPFGQRVVLPSISMPMIVLSWAFYHFLTRTGSKALRNFRPLLQADDSEIANIEQELNYLPPRTSWFVLILSILGSISYVFYTPNTFGEIVPRTTLPVSIIFIISVITVIPFYSQFFRMFRQVRILQDLFQRASHINLLHLEPANAFARLTASTGGGLILLMVMGIAYNPEIGAGINLVVAMLAVVISILIFILPLIGMRNRLIAEKNQRLEEISELLQLTIDKIHGKVRDQTDTDIGEAKATMGALIEERALFEKVSTWPWNTGTLRGFASTLLLPIVLWVITRLLEQYF